MAGIEVGAVVERGLGNLFGAERKFQVDISMSVALALLTHLAEMESVGWSGYVIRDDNVQFDEDAREYMSILVTELMIALMKGIREEIERNQDG